MSNIDPNVSPWFEVQHEQVECQYCRRTYVYHFDLRQEHEPNCAWLHAWLGKNESHRPDMGRQIERRRLLTEKNS
jgi:hypothetical protein